MTSNSTKGMLLALMIFCWSHCYASTALAQNAADKTILTIEIMLPAITGNALQAQRWGKAFQEIGESVRISQPLPSDKPEIKENRRGTFRFIKIVGELLPNGDVKFPGKTFSLKDTEQIKAWLNEIKVYGAQGSPDGKKFWGLNKAQFEEIVKTLSQPVEFETKGLTVREVLDKLPLVETSPMKIHPESRELFAEAEKSIVSQSMQPLSSGTVLAAMLRVEGFGFRPLRTPSGNIELTIESLQEISDPWPIGWDIDESKPRNTIVPNLFKFVRTGFEKAPLAQVLEAISEQTKTPILVDERLCQEKMIDIKEVGVSYPEKQTAWSLVLSSVVRQATLKDKIMLDEAGTPFIWVAPFIPYTPKKN